jgi:hypothetical protein
MIIYILDRSTRKSAGFLDLPTDAHLGAHTLSYESAEGLDANEFEFLFRDFAPASGTELPVASRLIAGALAARDIEAAYMSAPEPVKDAMDEDENGCDRLAHCIRHPIAVSTKLFIRSRSVHSPGRTTTTSEPGGTRRATEKRADHPNCGAVRFRHTHPRRATTAPEGRDGSE